VTKGLEKEMPVINRVPELLAEKFGGADKVILQRVAQDTRLTYSTVSRWAKRDIDRADFPILETWCKYFGVGVGDILVYQPSKE
jgi:DNA-binding Xre family transcriptional regulator